MNKSNEILCKEIKEGNIESINELVNNNEKLIYSLMNRFCYEKFDKEDLFSCSKYALIKAAYNFDESYGCLFSTYAVPLILGEIKKYFRDNSLLHVTRSNKDLYRLISKTQEMMEMDLGRSVSLYEISEKLDMSIEDVLFAYESHAPLISLDSTLNDEDNNSLMDIIPSDFQIVNQDLKFAIEKLDDKERLIIQLRYYDGLTQDQVAQRLYLSQVQISRLEKKILKKIKQFI